MIKNRVNFKSYAKYYKDISDKTNIQIRILLVCVLYTKSKDKYKYMIYDITSDVMKFLYDDNKIEQLFNFLYSNAKYKNKHKFKRLVY
jgi:hypothetical protein